MIKFLRVVDLREAKHLPHTPCIYAIVQDDILLYIGSTIDLRDRFKQHHVLKVYRRSFCNPVVFYAQLHDGGFTPQALYAHQMFIRPLLLPVEKALIAKFNPPLNQTLPAEGKQVNYWSEIHTKFLEDVSLGLSSHCHSYLEKKRDTS